IPEPEGIEISRDEGLGKGLLEEVARAATAGGNEAQAVGAFKGDGTEDGVGVIAEPEPGGEAVLKAAVLNEIGTGSGHGAGHERDVVDVEFARAHEEDG